MLIRDIAITAAGMVGDSVLLGLLGDEDDDGNAAAVKLMLTSVLSALPIVAADFPAPAGTDGATAATALDDAVDHTCADVYTTAYLAARNYCLFNGHTDEASYFDGMYDEAAERHRLKRRAFVPPPSRRYT